ncbi:ABC transporter substrate-binding protein [Metabacillus litoralis]|uniref:ABC transporter substrate-binding protein n=1 Tax=Metabacillus litoralis TaxID=152268 RepID=UPI002041E753|nr:ABC transporter substrate-binding protein [Metabacillus litoralis]MCM3161363.1 ABC transporter substrate-binding protein [Metabacillus litoralis]
MKQIEHLLILRNIFDHYENNEEITITLKEVAEILSISERNANYLIKKLSTAHKLKWVSGRGRGKKSTLLFLQGFIESAEEYVSEMVSEEKIIDVVNFINASYLNEEGRKSLYTILSIKLGPKIEKSKKDSTNVIKILLSQEITTLTPMDVLLYSEAHLVKEIYSTLVTYDHREQKLSPGLAYAWNYDNNEKKWTFYLRKSVMFHRGEIFTAADVKFTFKYLLTVGKHTSIAPLLDDLLKVEINDEHTISFYFKEQNLFFPRVLTSFHCSVLHHSYKKHNLPNGTGPFRVMEHTKHFIRLVAFDSYFRERPLIDSIDIWMQKSNDAPNNASTLEIGEKQQKSVIHKQKLEGSRFLLFNQTKNGYQSNSYFRLCIKHLINPSHLVNELKGNRRIPATSFLTPYSKKVSSDSQHLDIAENYLQKSHYAGEIIKLYYFNLNEGYESACWIQKEAKKIGLNISLTPISYDNHETISNADFVLLSVILDRDVEVGLYTLFKSDHSFIRNFFRDETKKIIDTELASMKLKKNRNERISYFLQIEEILKKDHTIHFLYHATNTLHYHSSLKGVSFDSYGLTNFHSVWIDPLEL